jgi:hypothetical protein
MDILEIGLRDMDWIGLAPNMESWRARLNVGMSLPIP